MTRGRPRGVLLDVLRLGLVVLTFACLFSSAFAQTSDDRLGLTRDQILAMGDDKWFDLFSSKRGDSEEAITTACRTYADALHERSTERLKKLPNRDRLLRWYAALKAYGDSMFQIQARNGGSMWIPVEAAQAVDIEEVLDKLEDLEERPDPKTPPDLEACGRRVLAHHEGIAKRLESVPTTPYTGIGRVQVEIYNNRARKELATLIPDLVRIGGQQAYLVIVTCSKLSDPAVLFKDE